MLALLALSLAAAEPAPHARAGYPKLYRCQSAIERPVPLPGYAPACLAFRAQELARIRALPIEQRRRRVAALRTAIGVPPGEGMALAPDGSLRPADDVRRGR